MSLLDTIKAHAGADRRRVIEVPEWGGPEGPLKIWYWMVTLADLAFTNEQVGGTWQNQAPFLIALKAQDEAGARLFRQIDHLELREKAAPDVVNRVAVAMLGRLSDDDAQKN